MVEENKAIDERFKSIEKKLRWIGDVCKVIIFYVAIKILIGIFWFLYDLGI